MVSFLSIQLGVSAVATASQEFEYEWPKYAYPYWTREAQPCQLSTETTVTELVRTVLLLMTVIIQLCSHALPVQCNK